jgi:hypothetical protein
MAERSIDAYLAGASPEAATLIAQVRAIIHEMQPDVVESIPYGMPTFASFPSGGLGQARGRLSGLACTGFVESRIVPLRAARDTVQLPLSTPLDDAVTRECCPSCCIDPERNARDDLDRCPWWPEHSRRSPRHSATPVPPAQ